MAVLSNVLLGMQIPLSSYLQVCFSITNDVVMSIALMYEKAEADLMLRKPRNAKRDRLTDWRLFFQIYLVSCYVGCESTNLLSNQPVPWTHGLALLYGHVVCVYGSEWPGILRRHPDLQQVGGWLEE